MHQTAFGGQALSGLYEELSASPNTIAGRGGEGKEGERGNGKRGKEKRRKGKHKGDLPSPTKGS